MVDFLEVCVDNVYSALNAEIGGADRIELCHALQVGGVTPSAGLVRKVKELLDIPVFVMIRPRSGNFCYNSIEQDQMAEDIETFLSIGVDGFVFGALNDGLVDKPVCEHLIEASKGLPVTFHRAFDLVENPDKAASAIISLGFSRILTSGQSRTAYEGMQCIKRLVRKFNKRIIIMPGCGINCDNFEEIKQVTNASEYHSSCQDHSNRPQVENIVHGASHYTLTSIEVVQIMKDFI